MALKSRLICALPLFSLLAAGASAAHAQAFTAGDVVVYRVGTGSAALTSAATAVFLDEYTPSGTFVESVALPTTVSGSNQILTASGTATSEGELNLSANGQYLALTGYDAAVGTAAVASSSTTTAPIVPRTVAIVTGSGAVDTSTALTTSSITGNNIRGAYTADGTNIYIADAAGGVQYATDGSSTSTQLSTTVTNARDVVISNGQLYVSTASGSTIRIGTVGTGTPTTSGQSITNLTGLGTTVSPYAFLFATLNSVDTSPDTLYVADNGANSIDKFSLEAGSWVATGTVAGLTGLTGLTGSTSNGVESLYATEPGGIYSLTDASGFGGTLTGTATEIATAGTNEGFRGIAFAPQALSGAAAPEPVSLLLLGLGVTGLIARRRALRD